MLNVVKAKYGLRDKSQAVERVIAEYADCLLEPEFKPEFVGRMARIDREKAVRVDADEFFGLGR